MTLSSASISSIELVQSEIETTIHHAEKSLERFQENRDSGEDLQNCIDCLNQLRGIFVLVEVQGCVLLCQESVALANELPVGANDDKNNLLTSLSNAIFILRRYTEYFCQKKLDHPELLLPIINELRIARKAKPFPESHFFEFSPAQSFDATTLWGYSKEGKLEDFEHHAKRFRHMYQVGLLDMLRDRNHKISLSLLARAAKGSIKICSGEPLSEFWALVCLVCEIILQEDLATPDLRKRLFMRVEKYLREMALVGSVVRSKSAPDSLTKELLYILALSGSQSERVEKTLNGYRVSPLGFTEATLRVESRRLFGPGVDVLRSLSSALQEEMTQLKDKLDILERSGEPKEEDLDFICGVFERLSSTLSMLDLGGISEACDEQAKKVRDWKEHEEFASEQELHSVADAILNIESAIQRFEETGIQTEIKLEASGNSDESHYFSEAIIVVIEESRSGLALAKRSITSYVESGGDKLHLSNISHVMDCIRGAMTMIHQPRVSNIVVSCLTCIMAELVENEVMPEEKILETLADALASLEYFIESMGVSENVNDSLLKLSEDSLESIGYAHQT